MVLLLALCLTVGLLVGCSQDAAPQNGEGQVEKKPVLGAAMFDLNHPFYIQMMEAGEVAAEDYGVEVIWQSSDGSLEKEVAIVENFIEQGVDCILIDPIDNKGIIPVVNKATEAGIPVVTMGNFVDAKDNVNTLYPDYDNYATLTEMMAAYLGYEGKVVLLVGARGNWTSDQRQLAFEDTVAKYPNIEVLAIQPSDYDPAKGMQVTENWMTSFREIDAFMCVSDGVTFAAIEAIKNAGRLDEIKVFSYDGEPAASELIKDDTIVADVLTGAKRVGYWNVKVGALLAKGEKFEHKIYLPTHFVLKEETLKKIKENGFEEPSNFSWVDPDEGIRLFDAYQEELGPKS